MLYCLGNHPNARRFSFHCSSFPFISKAALAVTDKLVSMQWAFGFHGSGPTTRAEYETRSSLCFKQRPRFSPHSPKSMKCYRASEQFYTANIQFFWSLSEHHLANDECELNYQYQYHQYGKYCATHCTFSGFAMRKYSSFLFFQMIVTINNN